jgi:hypothetical protein
MNFDNLEWTGRAFPAARVSGPVPILVKVIDRETRREETRRDEAFEISTSGNGREYLETGPKAYWINFALIANDDADAIQTFVRRHGDPFGTLTANQPTSNVEWSQLQSYLLPAYRLFDPVKPNGSQSRGFYAHDRNVGQHLLDSPYMRDIDYVPEIGAMGQFNVRVIARSLAGFMVASAITLFTRVMRVRPCSHCGEFFRLERRDTQFCSPSCRALFSTAKKKG